MAVAEEEEASYALIEPSHFDLIVIGTGLPESIIAAVSSASKKSVLHLDPNSFYGSHFSSLPLDHFISFLQSQQNLHSTTSSTYSKGVDSDNHLAIELNSQSLYSDIEISSLPDDLEPARKFSLDLSGPRVLFCAGPAVDLLLKSGASHHVEFKSVDASFVYGDGKFLSVPDSRSAIFKDRSLSLTEKNQLMRFFKLVQEHFESTSIVNVGEEKRRISDEDLESPFVDFLGKQKLPPKIKSIILYAISMADYDQDSLLFQRGLVKTKDGIKSLILYHSSVGRFPNALGALICPIYGQGELSQAFCRCAAVKGALYVLRMTVRALLVDKESKHYCGVRLASGQELFCNQLVTGPSFLVPSPPGVVPGQQMQQESSDRSSPIEVEGQVARAVCIIRGSIRLGLSNLLVVFPPRSLYSEQVASVRVLQLGSGLAVCPSGLFILYLSAWCDVVDQGKESLHAAMNALLSPSSGSQEKNFSQSETLEESVPTLLWSSMYIQKLMKGSSEVITTCPAPDGNLDYRDILESTMELFYKMYPQEEFMPESKAPEDADHDISE